MSVIRTGWRRVGRWIVDAIVGWVAVEVTLIVIGALLLIIAGLSEGTALPGEIPPFVILGKMIVLMCWLLLGVIALAILTFIIDLLINVVSNLAKPGVSTWRRFWLDMYHNGSYFADGFAGEWNAMGGRIRSTISTGERVVTEGARFVWNKIKSLWPWD